MTVQYIGATDIETTVRNVTLGSGDTVVVDTNAYVGQHGSLEAIYSDGAGFENIAVLVKGTVVANDANAISLGRVDNSRIVVDEGGSVVGGRDGTNLVSDPFAISVRGDASDDDTVSVSVNGSVSGLSGIFFSNIVPTITLGASATVTTTENGISHFLGGTTRINTVAGSLIATDGFGVTGNSVTGTLAGDIIASQGIVSTGDDADLTVAGSITTQSGGVRVTGNGADIRVAESGSVTGATRFSEAIEIEGNDGRVRVDGLVSAGTGVRAEGDNTRVEIGREGSLTGTANTSVDGGYGVLIQTDAPNVSDDVVVNHGSINGVFGVVFDARNAGGDITMRVVNSGSITGTQNGVSTADVGEAVVYNSGTITGESSSGLDLAGTVKSAVVNHGTITGGPAQAGGSGNGAVELGQNARLVNEGAIVGDRLGVGASGPNGFGVEIVNRGTITGDRAAIDIISAAGESHSVTNTGELEGSFSLAAGGGGSVSAVNTGTMDGNVFATGGTRLDLFNAGEVVGAVTLDDGGTVRNAGTLSGDISLDGSTRYVNHGEAFGTIDVGDGGSARIVNAGTMTGNGFVSLLTTGAGSFTSFLNTGEFNGSVNAGGRITIDNLGTIAGGVGGSDGAVTLINRGAINGAVVLGGGADFVDNSRGTVGGLTFDSASGIIDLGGGSDTVFTGAQNEDVDAGSGNDTIYASAGRDVLDGGEGTDIVDFRDVAGAVTVNLNLGVTAQGAAGTTLRNVENVYGTRLADQIGGDNGANDLVGRGGNDTLFAGGGDDRLFGGSGDDTLLGGGGDDVFVSGSGTDLLDGGMGADIADYRSATGNVSANLTTGGNNQADTYVSIESLYGGSGNDSLGGDMMDNVLFGAGGNDILFAGGGSDTLLGGSGDDTLVGGGGSDRFYFAVDDDRDTINDFQDGIDLIDVTGFGFTDTAASNDVTSQAGVMDTANGVELDFGDGDVLVLRNITANQLSDADFLI